MEELKDITPKEEKTEEGKRRLWSSMFTEGENESQEGRNLRDLVTSMNIDSGWMFRQIPLLLLVVLSVLLMVTNRYQAQQEIIEKEQLQKDVDDWRYRSLTRSSELTQRTRQSMIEENLRMLGDSTLAPAKEPPFTITPEE